MKNVILFIIALLTVSCSTTNHRVITVDGSQGTLRVTRGAITEFVAPCETSRYGFGTTIGSHKTPLGTYQIGAKHPKHHYGLAVRLAGYQGESRGILFHQNFPPYGTNGCITLARADMAQFYQLINVGDIVIIKR